MKAIAISKFKGDISGGITAAVIALPLAIAFGVASGAGAAAGLYGAIIVGLFASIFGGTPTQISGPTGPMTVVLASIIAMHSGNPNLIFATVMFAGIFQILFGFLKLGKIVNFIPYPVISGFMNGIGVIIILLQINSFLGLSFDGSPIEGLFNIIQNFNLIIPQSVILGIMTLLIVFFTPKKINEKIPSTLIALVLVTIFSSLMKFNVATIGTIPNTFPNFTFPILSLTDVETIIPIALTLAVLGSIDSLLTSLVADSLTKTKHNSNKELIGQGIGNTIASLFGGIAGSGATMRTVVNIKSGGTSKLSGIVHSIFLILIILFFAPAAAQIPLAVLAGILIKVGISIIDYKFLKVIKSAHRSDLAVMFTVFFITVLNDLILAVGIGVILSSMLFAVNIAKQTNIELVEPSDYFEEDSTNKVMIMHIDGILFFGSASQIASRMEDFTDNRYVIIDCGKIKSMDVSSVFALEDLILNLKDKNVEFIIVFNNRKVAAKTLKLGLKKLVKKENIAFGIKEALSIAKLNNEC